MEKEKTANDILPERNSSTPITCPLHDQDCPVQKELNRLQSECKRLQELSRTDPLTGFFNFRHLQTLLSTEMERTRRSGLPTGLLMVDLDHFKQVNDTYGHEAGNKVLKWVSKTMLENLRRIDIPCRFGGEEFAIILPVTRLPHAVNAAERLRRALEKNPVTIEDKHLQVTASFGVDVYRGRIRLSPDAFIERADRFLFEAKAQGRNCVSYDRGKAKGISTEVTREERKALFGKEPLQE
ncbi:MAG: GGDEF domain-containing protein [Deltaproteobacteria bacterium]|nr:MAG: GGDEF domain-containing protein [Deltaproteobacteria bacterium]